jgi:hypothetical protein
VIRIREGEKGGRGEGEREKREKTKINVIRTVHQETITSVFDACTVPNLEIGICIF